MSEYIKWFELTEDGKGIKYIPTGEVAPSLREVTDNLNDLTEQLEDYKKELNQYHNEFGDIHFEEAETIDEWFTIWNRYIYELSNKENELLNVKETYSQMEQDILNNTDFKELYGRNNESVRKAHIKNELKDIVDTKHDLELRINFLKRRIEYIKELMRMQKTLLEYGGNQL